jgi:hypothetical protein
MSDKTIYVLSDLHIGDRGTKMKKHGAVVFWLIALPQLFYLKILKS